MEYEHIRPCPLHASPKYPVAAFAGVYYPDVLPCDENLIAAIYLREFIGTDVCPRIKAVRPQRLYPGGKIDVSGASLTSYLLDAARGKELNWVEGVTDAHLGSSFDKGDLRFSMFVKCESYVGKDRDTVKPRIIKACPDWYKAHFGPITAEICNKWVERTRDPAFREHCIHNMPAFKMTGEDVGAWLDEACLLLGLSPEDVAYIENDCSAWDSSVSLDALELEHDFYKRFTNAPTEWLDLFKLQYRQKCYNSGHNICFTRTAGRASGVPNTSLGNTIINLSLHRYLLDELNVQGCLIAMGDDMLCVAHKQDAARICKRFETGMTAFGFRPKAKHTTIGPLAEFCSCWIGRTPSQRHILVPKVGKQFFKLTRVGYRRTEDYVATLTGLRDHGACPFMAACAVLTLASMGQSTAVSTNLDNPNPFGLGWTSGVVASMDSFEQRYGNMTPFVWLGNIPLDDPSGFKAAVAIDSDGVLDNPPPPFIQVLPSIGPSRRARSVPAWTLDVLENGLASLSSIL